MKTFPLPANFDGTKFATRYALTSFDFYVNGTNLFVPDSVPDNPIFDVTDAPEIISRKNAVLIVDSTNPNSKALRAIVAIVLDEFNLHALKIKEILDAMDAATTLVDLKARVAIIADHPARTMAQLITAIKNKINNGNVD